MVAHPLILDGKKLADEICENLKARVDVLKESHISPKLNIVTASDDPASKVYVRNKLRRCEEIGIEHNHIVVPKLTAGLMYELNVDDSPTIIQMPFLSDELRLENLGDYITAENDVDGFVNKSNIADLATGKTPCNYPCTPLGVVRILTENSIKVADSNVLMIGRSNIVGRPLAMMLEHMGANVQIIHSKTSERNKYLGFETADIIISAAGHPNILSVEQASKYLDCPYDYGENRDGVYFEGWNKTFVDVGINRNKGGKLCGDIPEEFKSHGDAYTPVPGGVGPMTVAMLMSNTVEVYERRKKFMDECDAIIEEAKNHG